GRNFYVLGIGSYSTKLTLHTYFVQIQYPRILGNPKIALKCALPFLEFVRRSTGVAKTLIQEIMKAPWRRKRSIGVKLNMPVWAVSFCPMITMALQDPTWFLK